MGCLNAGSVAGIHVATQFPCGPFSLRRVSTAYLYQLIIEDINSQQHNKRTLETLDFRASGKRVLGFIEVTGQKMYSYLDKLDSFQAKILYNFKTILLLFDVWDPKAESKFLEIAQRIKEKASPKAIVVVLTAQLHAFLDQFPSFEQKRNAKILLNNFV